MVGLQGHSRGGGWFWDQGKLNTRNLTVLQIAASLWIISTVAEKLVPFFSLFSLFLWRRDRK
jgi:hypothetical protein